jgi:hypothetical protein
MRQQRPCYHCSYRPALTMSWLSDMCLMCMQAGHTEAPCQRCVEDYLAAVMVALTSGLYVNIRAET